MFRNSIFIIPVLLVVFSTQSEAQGERTFHYKDGTTQTTGAPKADYSWDHKTEYKAPSRSASTPGARETPARPAGGYTPGTQKIGGTYYHDGLTTTGAAGKTGFMDPSGAVIIPCIYDDAHSFGSGVAPVKKAGKWGVIDRTGKQIVPFIYDDAHCFDEGFGPVKQNGKWGYINLSGSLVVPCRYFCVGGFMQGRAAVQEAAGAAFHHIDGTGKQLD